MIPNSFPFMSRIGAKSGQRVHPTAQAGFGRK